ncbi:cellulose biosynthesis protein BcsO [Erwinia sp. HDF1-3R]|uniref:cellulose biosynthesis protein BcsO n=1 Tax=Erwinia sp. HDF1-3R TaxID=3141543 RepID=UPI0031F51D61
MKSYDDLQRFKEKTQTNHIEFKDMSDQTRHADNTNWAIIRQLMSGSAESALGNGQRIDVVVPQPADARAFSPASVPPQTLSVQAAQPVLPSQNAPAQAGQSGLSPLLNAPAQAGQPILSQAQNAPAQAGQPVLSQLLNAPAQAGQPELSPPPAQQQSVAVFAAAKPAAQPGGSLLDNISALLGPAEPALQPPNTQDLAAGTQPPFSTADTQPAGTQPPFSTAQTQPAGTQSPFSTAQTLAAAMKPPFSRTQPQSTAVPQTEQARFKQLFSATPAASAGLLSKDTLLQPLLERIASCR